MIKILDLKSFSEKYLSSYMTKKPSKFHSWAFKKYNTELSNPNRRDGLRLVIAAPRFNAKTTLTCLFLCLWAAAYELKHYIVIVSAALSKSEEVLSSIKREIELNEDLQRDFPNLIPGSTWKKDEIILGNTKIKIFGTGSKGIRGLIWGRYRPDLCLGDDLEDSATVRSVTKRRFLRESWFDKDFSLIHGGQTGEGIADYVVVGNVIDRNSLLNALLSPTSYVEWEKVKFKAIDKFPDNKELWKECFRIYGDVENANRVKDARMFYNKNKWPMTKGSKILWAEGDPLYDLMILGYTNKSTFELEKQNSTINPEEILFPIESLTWKDFSQDAWVRQCLERGKKKIYGAIDPSVGKDKQKGNPSCVITICKDPKTKHLFVLDIKTRIINALEQSDLILKMHNFYRYMRFGIETTGYQYTLKLNLVESARQSNITLPRIKEISSTKNKIARIQSLEGPILNGTFIFDSAKYYSDRDYKEGIDLLTTYSPIRNADDDVPDCLEMVHQVAAKDGFRPIFLENPIHINTGGIVNHR